MKLMRLCFKTSDFFISSSHLSREEQSSIPLLGRQMTVRTWIRTSLPTTAPMSSLMKRLCHLENFSGKAAAFREFFS